MIRSNLQNLFSFSNVRLRKNSPSWVVIFNLKLRCVHALTQEMMLEDMQAGHAGEVPSM